jgi:hypothetical protein
MEIDRSIESIAIFDYFTKTSYFCIVTTFNFDSHFEVQTGSGFHFILCSLIKRVNSYWRESQYSEYFMVLNSYFEIGTCLTYSSCSNEALAFTADAVVG